MRNHELLSLLRCPKRGDEHHRDVDATSTKLNEYGRLYELFQATVTLPMVWAILVQDSRSHIEAYLDSGAAGSASGVSC